MTNENSLDTEKKQWMNPELLLISKDHIQGGINVNELESTTGFLSS